MRSTKSTNELGPAEFFAFDFSKLKPGDILLSTVPLSIKSWCIRKATQSAYSHAAICTTTPTIFIEAAGPGTRPFSILRIGVKDKRWVRVLRLKTTVSKHADRALDAGKHAGKYFQRGYWLAGALAAQIPGVNLQEHRKFFCSHLVAQAYREAGVDLLPGCPPHKVTPKAISCSALLDNITNDILIPTDQGKWPMELDLTDVGIGTSPVDKEIEIRHRVADRMESALRSCREDLIDQSVLRKYGLVSLDKYSTDSIDKSLDILFLAYLENPSLAKKLDNYFVCVLEEEGYLSIPDLLFDETTLVRDQMIAYIIEQKMWDREKMENQLTSDRHAYSALLRRIDEFCEVTNTYKDCIKKTGLTTFVLLANTYQRHWDYAKEVCKVFRKTIDLLESVLSDVNEKDY